MAWGLPGYCAVQPTSTAMDVFKASWAYGRQDVRSCEPSVPAPPHPLYTSPSHSHWQLPRMTLHAPSMWQRIHFQPCAKHNSVLPLRC